MTPILHITHVDNLAGIVTQGGLHCINALGAQRPAMSIAHANIQAARNQTRVPVGPGGTVHDYVPFYLGERSPMLYANHRGAVESNVGGQRSIIYLVSSAEAVAALRCGFVFTDGHAIMSVTQFFDQLSRLSAVDWVAVHARDWRDTIADPDLKRRKQAEFLVHRFAPLALFTEIVVLNAAIQQHTQEVLARAGVQLPVHVRPAWYY